MPRVGKSWAKVVLVVVLVAVMAVPTGALSSTSDTKALKVTPYQTGYGAQETANGPSAATPSTSGPGNVTWTLCLVNGQLLTGNAACPFDDQGPNDVVYDSANGDIYITNSNSNNVSVVSGASNKVVATIPVGTEPEGAAYDSANGDIYVTNSNTVSVVSGASNMVVATILVGTRPEGVAYDSANGDIYVTNYGSPSNVSNTVSVVSGASNTVVANITVGPRPSAAAYDSANGNIYVTNYNSNTTNSTVSVVSGASNTVVATIQVGSGPHGVAYDSGNGDVYVTNYVSGDVSVVSGANNKVVATIPVGNYPYGAAYDSANGDIYVTTLGSNSVSVVSGANTTVVATIPVGSGPRGATYDNANGDIDISNFNSGSLSIITTGPAPTTYPVSFPESGLPAGTSWSVTLSGQTLTSTTSTITFSEPNGTYPFTVGAVTRYTANITWGNVTVKGGPASQSVTFTAQPPGQYSLNFSESGLPGGTNWSVTVGSTTHSSTGSTISFTEVNDTYHYTAGTVTGYTPSPSSGNVTVNGTSKTIAIAFAKASTGSTYTVTFKESGLPSGTSWSVILNGSTKSSTTTTITFQEANGTYSFSVGVTTSYTANPSSGSVKVNGGPTSQSMTFSITSSKGKTNQTTGFIGLPGYEGYVVAGVIVVAVAAVVGFMLMRKPTRPKPVSSSSKEPEEGSTTEKVEGKEEPSPEPGKKE